MLRAEAELHPEHFEDLGTLSDLGRLVPVDHEHVRAALHRLIRDRVARDAEAGDQDPQTAHIQTGPGPREDGSRGPRGAHDVSLGSASR